MLLKKILMIECPKENKSVNLEGYCMKCENHDYDTISRENIGCNYEY